MESVNATENAPKRIKIFATLRGDDEVSREIDVQLAKGKQEAYGMEEVVAEIQDGFMQNSSFQFPVKGLVGQTPISMMLFLNVQQVQTIQVFEF
jgi:hypothetical protein